MKWALEHTCGQPERACVMDSLVIFGWMNEDGTIVHDRERIVGNVRKAISGWKNSQFFTDSINREYAQQADNPKEPA